MNIIIAVLSLKHYTDGFVLSHHVEPIEVATIDRGFSSSDHNSVKVKIKLTYPKNNISIDR